MKSLTKLIAASLILASGTASYALADGERSSVPTCPLVSWESYQSSRQSTCGKTCSIIIESSESYTTLPDSSTPYEGFFCKPASKNEIFCSATGEKTQNVPCASASVQQTPASSSSSSAVSAQEEQLFLLINQEREQAGLSPLSLDSSLSALAETKSEDMVENHYFAHESPTLGSASDLLDSAAYSYVSVGENIARSSSIEKAHAALMSSADHKRNILGSQWKQVGIGVALDENGYPYVTELFVR